MVGTFEERNAKPCTADDDSRLFLDTGYDDGFIRGGLDVRHHEDDDK